MLTESVEIMMFVLSLGLSCLYSGSESALLSIPLDRVNKLIADGGKKGAALKFLADKPTDLLTTILVGNNLVNTFAASLTAMMTKRYFQDDGLAISVGITTILILIFGEILPKTFGRNQGERFAIPIITFIKINYYIFYPGVKIFSLIIHLVLGKNAKVTSRAITKDDIEFYINKAEKERTIDSKQIDLLSSILEFPKIKVKEIMVPRHNIKYISTSDSFSDVLSVIRSEVHSRYPVCNEELEKTLGFLHVKDLAFREGITDSNFNINDYIKSPFFVYEHMKIQAVFDHMKRKKIHMALVKNENGVIVGIITLEDIIEEIFGEIQDEHDDEMSDDLQLTSQEEGVILEANTPIRDLSEYKIEIPTDEGYSTLAGFLLEMLGNNFPKKGQIIVWEGFSFELVKVQNQEIKTVKITHVEGDHLFSEKVSQDPTDKTDPDKNIT